VQKNSLDCTKPVACKAGQQVLLLSGSEPDYMQGGLRPSGHSVKSWLLSHHFSSFDGVMQLYWHELYSVLGLDILLNLDNPLHVATTTVTKFLSSEYLYQMCSMYILHFDTFIKVWLILPPV
jgi:hypothetical protein